jgi:hypothetical protein
MVSNAQKTPFARSLEQFSQRKVRAALELLGQNLPASVAAIASPGTVVVNFELTGIPYTLSQIEVPVEGAEYVRLPIQVGMLGWVKAADAYLGGVSGLGGGIADLTPRPNLSNLVWSPIGNKNWSAPDDPRKLVLYGPDGAILRTADKKSQLEANEQGILATIAIGSTFRIMNLPVSPGPPGSLYNSGGTVKIS